MKKLKVYSALLAVLFALGFGLISSCTQYKNTFIHRGYHNMTSRYNVYFYARESLKEGVQKLEKSNKDDYTKILPMFIYGDDASSKAINPEMDKVIKKASLCITRHTIKDRKTKHEIVGAVRWIDNAWMALGKAHFYKREFFSGIETFEYVARTYKSKEKYEAWLWLLKTYNAMDLLSQSDPYISRIKNDKNFPKEFKDEFSALYAEFYIKQGLHEEAVKHLTEAISLTKNRKSKARFNYILAQLYEQTNDNKKAIYHFNKAISYKPQYDMVFNAKIQRSLLAEPTPENTRKIKHELLKMINDIKNDEYLDVIYYTIGQLEEREKNEDQAIDYYKLSAKNSISNPNQKAKSYLRLGDMSFERTDYEDAESYYDSTVNIIKEDFPGYELVLNKKKSLTSLVSNIRTIKREDSLQRIAAMDTASRNKFIAKMIKKMEEDELKKQEELENIDNTAAQNAGNATNPTNTGQQGAAGAWYFYNQQTRSFGIQDFIKKWGNNRKLEDNWRRSNKQAVMGEPLTNTTEPEETDSTDENGQPKKKIKKDGKSIDFYLQGLPLTQDLMDSSNKVIIESYYALGTIYREQLNNNRKSIEAFQKLNSRFPKNKYEASAYYQMYRMYLGDKNQPKAEETKNFLCGNYPQSDYCKIINDPDFAKTASERKGVVEAFYTSAYEAYTSNNFADALAKCNEGLQKYGKNDFTARFAYLRALCIGRTQPVDSLEQALRVVTIKYAKDPVYEPAKAMLDAIAKQKGGTVSEVKDTTQKITAVADTFAVNDNSEHYWVIVIPNGKGDAGLMRTQLSDFHNEYYSTAGMKTMSIPINNAVLVTVKSFKNKTEAMAYHTLVLSKNDVFKNIQKDKCTMFAISVENMSRLIQNKNISGYNTFFNKYYLGLKQ